MKDDEVGAVTSLNRLSFISRLSELCVLCGEFLWLLIPLEAHYTKI